MPGNCVYGQWIRDIGEMPKYVNLKTSVGN
jgi:hypothetical protein